MPPIVTSSFANMKKPGCIVLESVVRSFKPVTRMTLKWEFPVWTRADDIDPAAVKGRGSKDDERKSEKDRDGCYKLIEALRAAGRATKSILRGKTGLSKDRCDRLLDLLESKKTVAWQTIKSARERVPGVLADGEFERRCRLTLSGCRWRPTRAGGASVVGRC